MRALERLILEGHIFINDTLEFTYQGVQSVGVVCIPGVIQGTNGAYHATLSKWVASEIYRAFGTKPRFSAWDNVYLRGRVLMSDIRTPRLLSGAPFEQIIASYFSPRVGAS